MPVATIERVVGEIGTVVEPHGLRFGVDADGLAQQHARVLLLAQDEAERLRDVRRRERAGRHLVEERAEEVVVAAIDQRDVDIGLAQRPGGVEPAVAAADDQDAVSLSHLVSLRSGVVRVPAATP